MPFGGVSHVKAGEKGAGKGKSADDKLDLLLENMVTKQDLTTFKEEVAATVTLQVEQAVQPIKTQVEQLDERMKHCESRLNSGATKSQSLDPHDDAFEQIAFLGFPESASSQERFKAMEDFLSKYLMCRPQLGNNHYGARGKRELKKSGYAQYVDSDARDQFFDMIEVKSFTCTGAKITVQKGKLLFYRHRDYIIIIIVQK